MKTLAVAVAAVGLSSASAAQTQFAAAVEDLPLMTGLAETAATPFDTPSGRIVRVEARGVVEPADVAVYYAETLPALGWARDRADALVFRRRSATLRGDEVLHVRVERRGPDAVHVVFLIAPDHTVKR